MTSLQNMPSTAKKLYWDWLETKAQTHIRNNGLTYWGVMEKSGLDATSLVSAIEHNLGTFAKPNHVADTILDYGNFPPTFDQLTFDEKWVVAYLLASDIV